jgi:pseudaminic acid biosynthesis-associated methylase
MSADINEQEAFWTGEFGDDYIGRNSGEYLTSANAELFKTILARTSPVKSVVELGSNIGLNLRGLQRLLPEVELDGVEINSRAFAELDHIAGVTAHHSSIKNFRPNRTWDLAFTKTVLIHLDPEALGLAYEKLHAISHKYILLAEYYSPSPVEIKYRGHKNKLFKRDFAGEMLDQFSDLSLADYGFVYHRDEFPQDDINWFLLEKADR